jgi:hypothetical protein
MIIRIKPSFEEASTSKTGESIYTVIDNWWLVHD